MTPRPHPAAGPGDDLRRSLDRAVLLGRGGRLLAACGCWIAAASVVVAALAALDMLGGGRLGITFLPAAAKIAVVLAVAAVPTAVAIRRGIVRGGWPNRLGIALETEARHPRLGESLSRAVEFLAAPPLPSRRRDTGRAEDDPTDSPPDATARALRQLAIDQAAAAARDVGGPVLPGFAFDAGCTLAGIAAPLVLWASTTLATGRWADAVRRQLAAPSGPHPVAERPTTGPIAAGVTPPAAAPISPAVLAAAGRLAAAAAVERRLADVLAARFAQAPGALAESLPREQRHTLDELAAIQAACLRTIAAGRGAIRTAAGSAEASPSAAAPSPRDRLRAALARFAEVDRAEAEASPANIAANRLHLAADAAATLAEELAVIAAGLGASPGAADSPETTPIPPGAGPLAGIAAALDRVAAAHPGDVRESTGPAPDTARSRTTRAAPRTAAADREAGTAGADATTTDPRGGPMAAASSATAAAETPPIERIWDLLPAAGRSQTGRTAVESAPPAYRSAIDAYYRLLLQSLPDRSIAAPP